jgi:hypothetical protein
MYASTFAKFMRKIKAVLAFGRGQANLPGRWPIWPIGQGQRPKLAAKIPLLIGRGQWLIWPIWPLADRPNRPNRPKLIF